MLELVGSKPWPVQISERNAKEDGMASSPEQVWQGLELEGRAALV